MATKQGLRREWLAVLGVGVGAVVLAGCGSSGSSDATGGTGSSGSASAGTTVAIRASGGHDVLVDAQQHTLYVSDQEDGTVLCRSSACTDIWQPLTVAKGVQPTGPADVVARLTTLPRPDGMAQVALNGRPLYAFSLDDGPGDARGNGAHDSFDGTSFSWHEATPSGAASSSPSSSPSSGSSSDGGGYTY